MNFYVFRCVATFEYPSGVCPPSNPPNSARSAAPEEKPAPRKSHGVPEMALIVGHTTHESAWIWVRGSRNVRRLTVELRGVFKKNGESVEGCEVKSVLVYAERDYTDVVRFDRGLGLQPDMPYEVELTSEDLPTINGKAPAITGQLRTFSKADDPESFYFLHGSCNLPVDRMTALGSAAVGLLGAAATTKALAAPRFTMGCATGALVHALGELAGSSHRFHSRLEIRCLRSGVGHVFHALRARETAPTKPVRTHLGERAP